LHDIASWRAKIYSGINTEPPGRLIMYGPFKDPQFALAGWEKRSIVEIKHYSEKVSLIGSAFYLRQREVRIEIHYMVNSMTLGTAQIKFKNTVDEGCTGKVKKTIHTGQASPDGISNAGLVESAYWDLLEEKEPRDCGGYQAVYLYMPSYSYRTYGYIEPSGRVVVVGGWVDTGGQIVTNFSGGGGGCR
jgi:hypothetical protein